MADSRRDAAHPSAAQWRWRLMRAIHRWDYERLLPLIGAAPLPLAYRMAALRGWFNAVLGRDWRSVALQTRHIRRLSLQAAAELLGMDKRMSASADPIRWVRQRFRSKRVTNSRPG